MIVHWESTPKFYISGLNNSFYRSLPPPHPIREKVRQYNHNSPLELPHYVYISIRFKYSLQKFGFVSVNYVNERKNSRTKSSQTKQRLGAKNTLKHNAWNIAYCLWILYDLGSAIWLGDTLQSLNRVLAECRREDPYESWLTIETVETSGRLEWKAIHFVAFRKLNSDTSATISELPFSSLSLWVEKRNRGWWLRQPNHQLHR